jgi:phage/plasmid-associated DNA primase
MATKSSTQKKTPVQDGSVYQKEINSWTLEDLNNKLIDCETNLHLNSNRSEMYTRLAEKWLPKTTGRDWRGLPIELDKDDRERLLVNRKRIVDICGYMMTRADLLEATKTETTDINGDRMTLIRRIKRFKECYKKIVDDFIANDAADKLFDNPTAENADVDIDIEEGSSPYQKLLIYLLRQASHHGYRRYRDQCCKEIGNTRAWRQVKEIKDFVYDETQKEDNAEMWMNLTNRGNMANDVVRHLTNCKDIQFSEIKKDRHVWSFSNGLLDARPSDMSRTESGAYKPVFYPYASSEFAELDPTLVSCKYFDLPFDSYDGVDDWYNIPTPHIQKVLDYQRFEESVSRWVYVFLGRLCFDVNEMDGWQIIPFLKGIAQSGKSTLITKVARRFYECEDVSTLSNNIEKKFGLSSIYKGFMFISPEIKGDLQLEQAEFQSLVSGEDVSIARKCETALSFQWKTPGILGGNEVPNWKDNSGSILRRLATLNFGRQISPDVADPHLEYKLEAEMPAIMCKCLRAYLDYAHKYSDKDIWNVLPSYFKQVRDQVATITNTLQHFLCSEKFVYSPELFVPQKEFVARFNTHCKDNVLGTSKFTQDFFAGPFSAKELTVRVESVLWRGQSYSSQPVIYGLDFKQE